MLSKTNHYSRLTVLALTRHVKSTLNWSHVEVNTARDLLSLKSDKNSKTIKEGLLSHEKVLCNKHILFTAKIAEHHLKITDK